MRRVFSFEDFKDFRRITMDEVYDDRPCIVISAGTCGQASGANDIIRIVKKYILERKIQDKISLRVTGCQGFCEMYPFIVVEPGKNLYPKLDMKDVPQIIDAALKGDVVEKLLYWDSIENKYCISKEDIPFYKRQTRVILSKNELIDPIRILDYVKRGGYGALEKVLENPDSDWIIQEVKRSGLRGRGGAGFPTGIKWEVVRESGNGVGLKFIVCNGDEGDPGAYMDRSLLESNPHSIIEGMIIAGIAIGSSKGIIYVRNEYPLAIKHLIIAIRQASEINILGEDILGTGLSFDIEIVQGAGAFVCGEETALIRSIEGKRGEPRQRPPYPADKGIWGFPTCINNVETLANIPIIINEGADEYAKIGVPGNTGTKIFSLVGKIKNTGLVEVPMGITIGEIIYNIGGGPIGKSKIKAVQTGGPSGGCIPCELFDLPIDYDSLTKAGSIMGSGGMIVMDENTCMVDVAKYFTKFLKEESCGKCVPCREGTQGMFEILNDITKGEGKDEDIFTLEELGNVIKDTSLCGLGQTSANSLLSTIRYFKNEYIEHIKNKRCPALVCKGIVGAPCQSACPLGTEVWRYVAYIQRGEYEEAYKIIRKSNPLPSICARVCNYPCENKCRSGIGEGQPIAIRALKRFITDRVNSSLFKSLGVTKINKKIKKVAIIGAGPAGLTAAHYLSLNGYKITIFEAEDQPGGMLVCGIPSYRLPRDILKKEIDELINKNITLKCNNIFGKDITLDNLFNDGFKAVFLALGAHKSRRLNLKNEDVNGIYKSIHFLKLFNLHNKSIARGRVGVIGGGNSAVDSARVALRQKDVESVTIFYRRAEQEMPAFSEEIKLAIKEGIKIETLVSPLEIQSKDNQLLAVKFIKNKLGGFDLSGRRAPIPIQNTEFIISLDTLIVAIGEQPDIEKILSFGFEFTDGEKIKVDKETLLTNIPGVFAGGDLVSGPNTVVDAIASGEKAAIMINRFLCGMELSVPAIAELPQFYIEPLKEMEKEFELTKRVEPSTISAKFRVKSFEEIELTFSEEEAIKEAKRCLRCDLEFTKQNNCK